MSTPPADTREQQRAAFARRHGAAPLTPLAQDASFRRYFRTTLAGRPAVLMDADPAHEDVAPYLRITALLAAASLSVPAIHAADQPAGLLLLEDFGDTLLPALLTEATGPGLYAQATDTLAALHRIPPPPGLPAWNAPRMAAATEATFLDWWWPARLGTPPTPAIRAAFQSAMHAMLAPLQAATLTHRDYFAGNLFHLPHRDGIRRTGVIDFQDAASGPAPYDLVSLIEDARRDLPDPLRAAMRTRYLAARPELDPATFAAEYAACAAQRHLRVACLWVRLARRDHKPHYLRHGPRCWALLARALAHPATAPLRAFLDAHVPPPLRSNPPEPAA